MKDSIMTIPLDKAGLPISISTENPILFLIVAALIIAFKTQIMAFLQVVCVRFLVALQLSITYIFIGKKDYFDDKKRNQWKYDMADRQEKLQAEVLHSIQKISDTQEDMKTLIINQGSRIAKLENSVEHMDKQETEK